MCGSRKYPYSPHRRDPGREDGGSQRPKNLKQCMKLNWNFRRGGGVIGQIPSVGGGGGGGYGYFLEPHNELLLLVMYF